MPELPDVMVYCEALARRVRGEVLQRVELKSPFVLRTAVPPIASAQGKRALTDPRLFSGIGNAYSDEILHRARLSPLMLTRKLGVTDIARCCGCCTPASCPHHPVALRRPSSTTRGVQI